MDWMWLIRIQLPDYTKKRHLEIRSEKHLKRTSKDTLINSYIKHLHLFACQKSILLTHDDVWISVLAPDDAVILQYLGPLTTLLFLPL